MEPGTTPAHSRLTSLWLIGGAFCWRGQSRLSGAVDCLPLSQRDPARLAAGSSGRHSLSQRPVAPGHWRGSLCRAAGPHQGRRRGAPRKAESWSRWSAKDLRHLAGSGPVDQRSRNRRDFAAAWAHRRRRRRSSDLSAGAAFSAAGPLSHRARREKATEFLLSLKDQMDRAAIDARLDLEKHTIAADQQGIPISVYEAMVALQYAVRDLREGTPVTSLDLRPRRAPRSRRSVTAKISRVSTCRRCWQFGRPLFQRRRG